MIFPSVFDNVLTVCLLGLGDPASFYVAVIFLLNGLMMSLFFIYGTYLR